jgi:hypothetical protein
MKLTGLMIVLTILLVLLSISQSAFAQTNQVTYTANLTYLTVQLSYPSEVLPGSSVTVNLQANAKSSITSANLTTQVYYADGPNLRQLGAFSVVSDSNLNSGSGLSKQMQFTVPQDAPRTSLLAVVTENVQTASYTYSYYPSNYYYSNYPSCSYYGSYYPYCYYRSYYGYYSGYYGYAAYPSYSYSTTTDSSIVPLSYIRAMTPEYVSLQSSYQMVQQQLAQTQAENQQLKQNLQNSQNTIAQQNATIANLNQQVSSTRNISGTLEAGAAIVAIIAIVLGVLLARERGKTRSMTRLDAETSQ